MKKITFLLLTILPFLGFSQTINGTFDSDITGWVEQNSATISWDATEGNSAAGALKIEAAAADNSGAKTDNTAYVSTPGNYILRAWVKGTAGNLIRLDAFQDGAFIAGAQQTLATSDWEMVTQTFNGLTTSAINFRIIARTPSATYFIDDVDLVETVTLDAFISNPDFENVTIDPWTVTGGETSLAISGTASSGTQAGAITFTADQTANQFLENEINNLGQFYNPSEFNFSFDAQSTKAGTAFAIRIRTYDDLGAVIETQFTGAKTLSGTGAYETVTFNKAHSGTPFQQIKVDIRLNSSTSALNGDVVTIDNIVGSFSDIVLSTSASEREIDFKVYPNPAKDVLYIKGLLAISKVSLYDITGKLVLQNSELVNDGLDITSLKSGLYMVEITNIEKATATRKIVVE